MEENKKERTVDQIRAEYSQLCAKAGHTQYQVHTLNKDLEIMNNALRDLNQEASLLSQKEAEAKAQKAKEQEESKSNEQTS